MAGTRSGRASRSRVSYAESSMSESEDDDGFVGSVHIPRQPPSLPARRTSRKRNNSAQPLAPRQHRTKRIRSRLSYAEPNTSSEESGRDVVFNVPPRRIRKATSAGSKAREHPRPQPKSTGKDSKDTSIDRSTFAKSIESDGVRPDWTSLPYEILLLIFQHAIYPLHEETSGGLRPTTNVNWAVGAVRVCRAFSEPALTALYECPPIHFPAQPFGLMDLLSSQFPTTVDYRSKIRRLHLDSTHSLAYAMTHRGRFHLESLLQELPQLQDVDIVNHINTPPFFSHNKRGVWNYPVAMFAAMNNAGIRLRKWRWCGEKMNSMEIQNILDNSAGEACLRSVRDLTLSQLTFLEDRPSPIPSAKHSPFILPEAIRALSELRSLTIETCNVLTWNLLTHLPNKLHRLTIINCPDFDPDTLNNFLLENGQELRELDISHNNLIDLSFLPDLKATCPKLQLLRMDHMFYSTAVMFKSADAEPRYDTLLVPGLVPTWPSTLRKIELLSLRKWSSEAAACFFQSLIDSATELTHLRYLTVRAMLDISWRDRAGFRDKYIGKLEKVFLDRSRPPNPHLASYKAYRLWKERVDAEVKSGKGRSERRTTRVTAMTSRITTSDQEDDDVAIQGLCVKVDINIDNMRPTEHQFREDDFMDSEISGDEEWTGADAEPSRPTRYGW